MYLPKQQGQKRQKMQKHHKMINTSAILFQNMSKFRVKVGTP